MSPTRGVATEEQREAIPSGPSSERAQNSKNFKFETEQKTK
jgi:hypothetical protein